MLCALYMACPHHSHPSLISCTTCSVRSCRLTHRTLAIPRLGQGIALASDIDGMDIGSGYNGVQMGDNLPPIDFANRGVMQVSPGRAHTCVLLQDDTVVCFGNNDDGQLGIGSNFAQAQMGESLVPTELFNVIPGAELEDLRLVGNGSTGILQMKYNGSWGLICDDSWSDAAAQVACRQLGLGGGRAFSVSRRASTSLALWGPVSMSERAPRLAAYVYAARTACTHRAWYAQPLVSHRHILPLQSYMIEIGSHNIPLEFRKIAHWLSAHCCLDATSQGLHAGQRINLLPSHDPKISPCNGRLLPRDR